MVGLCWYCFKLVPELLNEKKNALYVLDNILLPVLLWLVVSLRVPFLPQLCSWYICCRCGYIFKKYYIYFHLYADDTQTYIYFKPGDTNALAKLYVCTDKLKLWLMSNFLTLNEGKIEVILFEPNDALSFNS